jgi:glutathione S-transferase
MRDVGQRGLPALWKELEQTLDRLETRAPKTDASYWIGDALTVADVSLFGQLQALRTDLTPAQRLSVEQRPRLCAYLDRVESATRAL